MRPIAGWQRTRAGAGCCAWKAKPEARTLLRKRDAPDAAAPPLHRDAAKIQPKARFSSALLSFHEQTENLLRAKLAGQAWPFIVYVRSQELALVLDANRDLSPRRGIAQRVFQKIRKDALQTRRFGNHWPLGFRGDAGIDGKPYAFGFERRS